MRASKRLSSGVSASLDLRARGDEGGVYEIAQVRNIEVCQDDPVFSTNLQNNMLQFGTHEK